MRGGASGSSTNAATRWAAGRRRTRRRRGRRGSPSPPGCPGLRRWPRDPGSRRHRPSRGRPRRRGVPPRRRGWARARDTAHHAAQKSTITGVSRDRSITFCSNVCSVTSMLVLNGAVAPGHPFTTPSQDEAGDPPCKPGSLDDPHDPVDVLVGERRLLREALRRRGSGSRCRAPRARGEARGRESASGRPCGRDGVRRRGTSSRTSAASRRARLQGRSSPRPCRAG